MKTVLFLISLVLVSTSLAQTYPPENSMVETVATVQTDGDTEDICQASDGALYVTIRQESAIWKIPPGGQAERFAAFPEKFGIVGCAPYNDGLIVAAISKPYLFPRAADAPPGGPDVDFSDVGPEILILDETGEVISAVPGQAGQLFTAVTPLGGRYLVADAVGDTIWQFDPRTQRLEPWLQDNRFAPTEGDSLLGMEGIAAHDGVVVVSNINPRTLHRIDTDSDGRPAGAPVLLTQGELIPNDFAVGPGGITYVTSGTSVFKVTPSGQVSELAGNVPNGGAGIVGNDGEWFYWPTRGSAGTLPGTERVLRIPLE